MTFEERRKTVTLVRDIPDGTAAALETMARWNSLANDEFCTLGEQLSSNGSEATNEIFRENIRCTQERIFELIDRLSESGALSVLTQIARVAEQGGDA